MRSQKTYLRDPNTLQEGKRDHQGNYAELIKNRNK